MKTFFWSLLSLLFSCSLLAQAPNSSPPPLDSTRQDSITQAHIQQLADSLAQINVKRDTSPKYDTLGLASFRYECIQENEESFLLFSVVNQKPFLGKISINGQEQLLLFNNGKSRQLIQPDLNGKLYQLSSQSGRQKTHKLVHLRKRTDGSIRVKPIPLWWSILPPLMAILIALLFKQVDLALFLGIFSGAWIINGMPLEPYLIVKSFFSVLDTYIIHALSDSGHLSVILFSMMIGGVVALISRNGGMAGIVKQLAPLARGPKSTQLVAWFLGIAIFFDDYANSLIVGNTIRPLSDKYNISREKLAYIVDSTAAPIAAIAFITTWIGAELGYIEDALPSLEGIGQVPSAYSVFLSSLQYSYYSFFTLLFIPIIVIFGRDFGPMLKAERRARHQGQVFAVSGNEGDSSELEELDPKPGAPLRWINGLLPILVVVLGTLLGLIDTGMNSCYQSLIDKGLTLESNSWELIWQELGYLEADLSQGLAAAKTEALAISDLRKLGILIGSSDSYSALLWASLSAIIVAIFLSMIQGILKLGEGLELMVAGFKTMVPALLILVFAWSLALTTEELGTAEFLTSSLEGNLSPYFLPVVIFVLSALIAFSTGSSWSTMAILYPIAIPMTWELCRANGLPMETTWALLYNNIAIVLSASVLGDHCSPISDTTILSSLASNCRHIDHVRTQLPYALTVGSVSLACGYASTAFALPFTVCFPAGLAVLLLVVILFGRSVKKNPQAEDSPSEHPPIETEQ